MNAEQLIHEVETKGARLVANGALLELDVPTTFPEDLVQKLRQHKAEVLAALALRHEPHGSNPALPQASQLLDRLLAWAGGSAARWVSMRDTLLRTYSPSWERVDARDILVAWLGARVAVAQAQHELERLEQIRRPLTRGEQASKGGRKADISYYGRVAKHLEQRVPMALLADPAAARTIRALTKRTG